MKIFHIAHRQKKQSKSKVEKFQDELQRNWEAKASRLLEHRLEVINRMEKRKLLVY